LVLASEEGDGVGTRVMEAAMRRANRTDLDRLERILEGRGLILCSCWLVGFNGHW
jgi:hypothetical protein